MTEDPKYDVALSFAGEQRKYVDVVASSLKAKGVKVFYDDYEKVALWGKDLYAHLDWVYRKASRHCVVFVSADYAEKVWTNHERRSAQARAISENTEYLLPARFDETELPGLPATIGYLDLTSIHPEELADMIETKLGPRRSEPGFPSKVDRLWEKLKLKGDSKLTKQKKKDARRVAHSFYEAMNRMTEGERRAVGGVFAFGCDGDMPRGIHLSLDYLSRMTNQPKAELLENLAAVRPLNLKTIVRENYQVHSAEHGELVPDDRDILLHFWSSAVPDARNSTEVAWQSVQCAADHFCADHGLEIIAGLDFHRLSKGVKGPVVIG